MDRASAAADERHLYVLAQRLRRHCIAAVSHEAAQHGYLTQQVSAKHSKPHVYSTIVSTCQPGCGRNRSRPKRLGVYWCMPVDCTVLNSNPSAWQHLRALSPAISEFVSSGGRLAAPVLQLSAAALICDRSHAQTRKGLSASPPSSAVQEYWVTCWIATEYNSRLQRKAVQNLLCSRRSPDTYQGIS